MRISKKYSFSVISFGMLLLSIPFLLSFETVRALGFLYSTILSGLLLVSLLVVSVSYLTGQAKIDLEANYGKDDDEDSP
jgi:hypothetical protein